MATRLTNTTYPDDQDELLKSGMLQVCFECTDSGNIADLDRLLNHLEGVMPRVRWTRGGLDNDHKGLVIKMADAQTFHLLGVAKSSLSLRICCHCCHSVTDCMEIVAHGIVAPGTTSGLIGIDWQDVCEVLSKGNIGRLDILGWNVEGEMTITTLGDGSQPLTAALAVLLNPTPTMSDLRHFLMELRMRINQDVLLMFAAPACLAVDPTVVLLQVFEHTIGEGP